MNKQFLPLLTLIFVFIAGMMLATSTAAAAKSNDKITICHATGSASNPYQKISVSENAAHGHDDHFGDIFGAGDCPTGKPSENTIPSTEKTFLPIATPVATQQPATATDLPNMQTKQTSNKIALISYGAETDTHSVTYIRHGYFAQDMKPGKKTTPQAQKQADLKYNAAGGCWYR